MNFLQVPSIKSVILSLVKLELGIFGTVQGKLPFAGVELVITCQDMPLFTEYSILTFNTLGAYSYIKLTWLPEIKFSPPCGYNKIKAASIMNTLSLISIIFSF